MQRRIWLAIALVAIVWLALLVLLYAAAVQASPACPSQAEARARFRDAHLYWHYRDGARCWDNRRGRSTMRVTRRPEPAAAAPEFETPAPRSLPKPSPDKTLEDDPQWRWIVAARAAAAEAEAAIPPLVPLDIRALIAAPPGPPPDAAGGRWALALAAVVAIAAAAGVASWRWQASLFKNL